MRQKVSVFLILHHKSHSIFGLKWHDSTLDKYCCYRYSRAQPVEEWTKASHMLINLKDVVLRESFFACFLLALLWHLLCPHIT